MSSVEYSSKNMDHPGIVAMVCREIDLSGEIDRIVGVDPRQKVTCGEAANAYNEYGGRFFHNDRHHHDELSRGIQA